MHRLPQPARRLRDQATTLNRRAGPGLLQVPRGQGRAVRLRAPWGQIRGLRILSHPAWVLEPTPAKAQPGEPALPGVPHPVGRSDGGRAGSALVPQPDTKIPGLYDVSCTDPRLKLRPVLLQIGGCDEEPSRIRKGSRTAGAGSTRTRPKGTAWTRMPPFTLFRECLMKLNRSLPCNAVFIVALVLFLGIPAAAQGQEKPPEGVNTGNYSVKQTIEFGYRFVRDEDFKDPRGTRDVYNTFVNLDRGVRLFEHTLEMHSLNHQGWLFDNFYVSSFGY